MAQKVSPASGWLEEIVAGAASKFRVETFVDNTDGISRPVVSMSALGSGATVEDLASVFRIAGGAAMRGSTTLMEADLDDVVSVGSSSSVGTVPGASAFSAYGTPLGDVLSVIDTLASARRGASSVGFEEGFCYLRAIKEEHHSDAIGRYGNRFTCADVNAIPAEWIRDVTELDSVGVTLSPSGDAIHLADGRGQGAISAADLFAVSMRHRHMDEPDLAVLSGAQIGISSPSVSDGSKMVDNALARVPTLPCWANALGLAPDELDKFKSLWDVAYFLKESGRLFPHLKILVKDDESAHFFDTELRVCGRARRDDVQIVPDDGTNLYEFLENGVISDVLCTGDCVFACRSDAMALAVSECMKEIDAVRRVDGYQQSPPSYKRACGDAFDAARNWLVETASLLEMSCVDTARQMFSSMESQPLKTRALMDLRGIAAGGRSSHSGGWAAAQVEYAQVAVSAKAKHIDTALLVSGLPAALTGGMASMPGGSDLRDVVGRIVAGGRVGDAGSVTSAGEEGAHTPDSASSPPRNAVDDIMASFNENMTIRPMFTSSESLIDKLHALKRSPETYCRGIREQRLVQQIAAHKSGARLPPDIPEDEYKKLDAAHAKVSSALLAAQASLPSKGAGRDILECNKALSLIKAERKKLGERGM